VALAGALEWALRGAGAEAEGALRVRSWEDSAEALAEVLASLSPVAR
jgi:hypothetical protein